MSDLPMVEPPVPEPNPGPTAEDILTQVLQSLAQGQNNFAQLFNNQNELYARLAAPKSDKPKSRVAPPDPYDGTPEKLDVFLRQLYLTFSDDPSVFKDPMRKVRFALSYMKEKFALQWASRIIGELEDGTRKYEKWNDFRDDLITAFSNANKKEQAQRKLELLRQGMRPAEEYFVEFEEYKALAKYNDEGYIALLKRNLSPGLVRRIYELEKVPETYAKWKEYALRFDQNYREYQALVGNRKIAEPTPRKDHSADHRSAPPPRPEAQRSPPKSVEPWAGQPMDVDRTRSAFPERRTCYNCGEAGHISHNCPREKKPRVQRFRAMFGDLSVEERKEFRRLLMEDDAPKADFQEA